ncbi:hypothetical protein EJ08DRAFT_472587 [Tothia fuscella]|uniref:Uncharacterized protein n=1 Tax=Tothia fuscella TaxID=1048955 RepID=A0A9P4NZR2_9PEZI|nr:hypothetical protein EJ08DRAFT_472587 [Tothia fuscella]
MSPSKGPRANGDAFNDRESQRERLKRRSTLDPYNLFRARETPNPPKSSLDDTRSPAQRAASEDVQRALRVDESPPPSPPIQNANPRTHKFSMLRWRHASDSQLSTRARQHAGKEHPEVPPVPAMPTSMSDRRRHAHRADNVDPTPSIIMTAPTVDVTDQSPQKPTLARSKSRKFHPFTRQKQATGPTVVDPPSGRPSTDGRPSMDMRRKAENRKSRFGTFGRSKDPAEELRRLAGSRMNGGGGDEAFSIDGAGPSRTASSLQLPIGRKSESSRSEADYRPTTAGNPTTPDRPRPNHTNSTFSFLNRRNKHASLFPLPVRVTPPDASQPPTHPHTPRVSTSARSSGTPESPVRATPPRGPHPNATTIPSLPSSSALAAASISFAAPGGPLARQSSEHSAHSSGSSPALLPPLPFNKRARSSTVGSTSGVSEEAPPPEPPFVNGNGRDSTSTAGRSSFSNLFALNRLRHGSDPHSPRGTPNHGTPAFRSHSNSLHLARETYHLPDREEGETAIQYLTRADDAIPKPQIPSLLADNADEFHQAVMRSYMRKFAFFGDPLDMALRKLLMEVDLPNEAQQIDRVLQSFADRYHECNPGIFTDSEKCYFIAFSLMLLHSDFFNKNNKKKMLKQEYVKNTTSDGVDVSPEVLECFYENICYTPFIRVEDDMDIQTIGSKKGKKVHKVIKNALPEHAKRSSREPLDPYTFILEGNFDELRPPLKGVLALDDPYSYLGTAPSLDKSLLRSSKCGIIQLESARSRPDAFMSPSGIENPNEARAGVVDLPVDKVGVLWRKDPKKKTARSPWQEWGAILTGAGLYFFKNVSFVKNFIHQYEHHLKYGHGNAPVIFTPAVTTWKADYMLPTDNSVALLDTTYKKHKHAFVFYRHNNADEVFLADNESEMNDWLAKLNHQAAFKTAGIRQRGLVGGNYDGQRQRGMRRLESSSSTTTLQTVQTPTGDVTIQSGKIDHELAQQISAARRDNMQRKILEAEEKLAEQIRQLDDQLRHARHLLLLAPVAERTRNGVLHSASKVSVQLNWLRIEIWRLKCHRDILAMDLEEEKNEAKRRQDRIDRLAGKLTDKATSVHSQSTLTTPKPQTNGIERLNSNATTSTVKAQSPPPAFSPLSPFSSPRPGTQSSAPSDASAETGDEDVFRTPPETTPATTPVRSPLAVKTSGHRLSAVSNKPRSPRLRPYSLVMDDSLDSPTVFSTPMMTDSEAEQLREGGPLANLDGTALDRPTTANTATTASTTTAEPERMEKEDEPDYLPNITGSPDSRKVRRSFRGTLREGSSRDSTSSHHRHSRIRGKGDSTSSAVLPEDAIATSPSRSIGDGVMEIPPTEGLKREKGSFTVHGKKASVVTFGGEWANMTTEERLKGLQRGESNASTSASARAAGAALAVSPGWGGSTRRESIGGKGASEQGYKVPPRTSSLSLRERRMGGARKGSSASFVGTPTPPLFEAGASGAVGGFFEKDIANPDGEVKDEGAEKRESAAKVDEPEMAEVETATVVNGKGKAKDHSDESGLDLSQDPMHPGFGLSSSPPSLKEDTNNDMRT